jgi:two-component system LytT family response regulator
MKLRVLVVDDEPLARERVLRLLERAGDVEVVGECGDGRTAVRAIREGAPDLVFLDVEMPELDGFAVLESVGRDNLPGVVFMGAVGGDAMRAFEVDAVDYLLKPYASERFERALQRARRRISLGAAAEVRWTPPAPPGGTGTGTGSSGSWIERLMVKVDDRTQFVRVADIDRIESAGNYARLHVGRTTHLIRETLCALEAHLDPARFGRIHRRVLVNLARVREIQPWFGGDQIVILADGLRLRLSRGYRDAFVGRLSRAP